MSTSTTDLSVVRKTMTVKAPPERAFDVFTEQMLSWWPVGDYSIGGDKIDRIVFERHAGGRLYEAHRDGTEADWAKVLEWERPSHVKLAWRPASDSAPSGVTELEVRFRADGEGTRIELEHRGWEHLGERAAASRASYEGGWDHVLGRYNAAIDR